MHHSIFIKMQATFNYVNEAVKCEGLYTKSKQLHPAVSTKQTNRGQMDKSLQFKSERTKRCRIRQTVVMAMTTIMTVAAVNQCIIPLIRTLFSIQNLNQPDCYNLLHIPGDLVLAPVEKLTSQNLLNAQLSWTCFTMTS